MFNKTSKTDLQTCFVVLVFTIFGFLPTSSYAFQKQSPSTPTRIIPIPHPTTILLRDLSVQKELELREHQITALPKTLDTIELELFAIRDLPTDKRQPQAAAIIRRLKKQLESTLSTIQQQRLDQLTFQALGVYVIQQPDMQSRLNITIIQKQKINSLFESLAQNIVDANQPDKNSPDDDPQTLTQKLIAQSEKDLLDTLTESQRDSLTEALGKTFDLSNIRQLVCKAPEFQPVESWIYSEPIKLADQKGKVTVVHFYAFSCINCRRNLPHYNQWRKDFPPDQFQIIGIHTPETNREKILKNVKQKAAENNMNYPIFVDDQTKNWNAWTNPTWPAIYLIDKQGFIRFWWYGELNHKGAPTEKLLRQNIQLLLDEK